LLLGLCISSSSAQKLYRLQTQEVYLVAKDITSVNIGQFDLHGDLFGETVENLKMNVALDAHNISVFLQELDALYVLISQEVFSGLSKLICLRDLHKAQTVCSGQSVLL
jgi:hypothetical protein